MNKTCAIGHFGFGQNLLNGQTIKTKIVTAEIERQLGSDNVFCLDLAGGLKRIPDLLVKIFIMLRKCDNIVIMPVENGLMFLTPILGFYNLFFKKRIHYVVIGGWLPKFISSKTWLIRGLKKFFGLYVETSTMKQTLEQMGLHNLYLLPNCKPLCPIAADKLVYPSGAPYRLCTFSRVMPEKGIATAINAIKTVNEQLGFHAFSLDIYGQVWDDSRAWFSDLQRTFPDYVRYCGFVDADQSVPILKDYFALLFPTHFYTEGIPGTIIDAYAAGIPVISAKWESYADVVDQGKTGLGYDFDNRQQFEDILVQLARNPEIIFGMKPACLEKALDYIPETALQPLIGNFS